MGRRNARALAQLGEEIGNCRMCPRLVAWRELIAVDKRAAFRDEDYWGRGVPGFGDGDASIVVIGLAPAAHGANRTGRVFTGDRSGDFLFASLYRCRLANQPNSESINDGLTLRDTYVAAAVRCAPPENKPTPAERDACRPFLVRELSLLARASVLVVLGSFAYDATWATLRAAEIELPPRRKAFGHLIEQPAGPYTIIGSFHPSQQNTFTGRLTEPMLDAVFERAIQVVSASVSATK
jgi:uracil-DNA glycosylase family 4